MDDICLFVVLPTMYLSRHRISRVNQSHSASTLGKTCMSSGAEGGKLVVDRGGSWRSLRVSSQPQSEEIIFDIRAFHSFSIVACEINLTGVMPAFRNIMISSSCRFSLAAASYKGTLLFRKASRISRFNLLRSTASAMLLRGTANPTCTDGVDLDSRCIVKWHCSRAP